MFQFVKIRLKSFVTERKGRGAAHENIKGNRSSAFSDYLFLAALFLLAVFAAFFLAVFAASFLTVFAASFLTVFAASFVAILAAFLTLAAFVHAAFCFALLVGAAFAVVLCASRIADASGMFALVVANLFGLLGALLFRFCVLFAVA